MKANIGAEAPASANGEVLPASGRRYTPMHERYAYGGPLRRFESIAPKGHRVNLHPTHPALTDSRTLFRKSVFEPSALPRLLIDGHNSRKIGKRVEKGHWAGFPIFTLTLEERATCPTSCAEWRTCYGNSMPFARRIEHGRAFEERLWEELAVKQAKHPGGFVVRLHILGDFYSVDYAELWAEALEAYPALHVFGYTAQLPQSPVGQVIAELLGARGERFRVRFSGLDAPTDGAIVVDAAEQTEHLICPAQLKQTDCCATCGLKLQFGDRKVAAIFGRTRLILKIVDGSFPDYTRVIPTKNPMSLKVHATELARALRAGSVIADAKVRAVKLAMSADACRILSTGLYGDHVDEPIDAEFGPGELEVGLNAGLAMPMATAFGEAAALDITFLDPVAPDRVPGPSTSGVQLNGVPVSLAMTAYDVAGVARRLDGSGAAGLYETTFNPPITGTGGGTVGDAMLGGTGTVAVGGAGGGTIGDVEGSGTGGLTPITGTGGGTVGDVEGSGTGSISDPPITDTGPIIASLERTVAFQVVPAGSIASESLPLNAAGWIAAFDPSDRAPFAIDWSELLADGETIAQIDRIRMSAEGAALGVRVDSGGGRSPIISTDGLKTQFWFICDEAFQSHPAFAGAGVQVGLSVLTRTSSDPYKLYERTAVLNVRQQ